MLRIATLYIMSHRHCAFILETQEKGNNDKEAERRLCLPGSRDHLWGLPLCGTVPAMDQ